MATDNVDESDTGCNTAILSLELLSSFILEESGSIQVLGSCSSYTGRPSEFVVTRSKMCSQMRGRYRSTAHINVCSSDILSYQGCKIDHDPF